MQWRSLCRTLLPVAPSQALRIGRFRTQWTCSRASTCTSASYVTLRCSPSTPCRITAEPSDPAHRRFSNMRQAAKYIMQREGIGGFFKGYIPTLARGVSCNAVVFPVYGEFAQALFARWGTHTNIPCLQNSSNNLHLAFRDRNRFCAIYRDYTAAFSGPVHAYPRCSDADSIMSAS